MVGIRATAKWLLAPIGDTHKGSWLDLGQMLSPSCRVEGLPSGPVRMVRPWSNVKPAREKVSSSRARGKLGQLQIRVDSVAVGDKSQISIKTGASPNQQEIERRGEIVRQFFNDFWTSTDDKPRTFAERLNRAEGRINERLAEKPT